MLTLEAARERLLAAIDGPVGEVSSPIETSGGAYLARAPVGLIDLPPFDNSAMDGWAVRSADIANPPVTLTVQGRVSAGGVYAGVLAPGCAIRIFTGSPLPAGADAVVMQEDAEPIETTGVRILDVAKPWENVRLQGEDLRKGTPLIPAGTRLEAQHLALLAAAGVSAVRLHRTVRVGILPNGSELVASGQPLPPGGIYESNGIALADLVARTGALTRRFDPPRDDLPALQAALATAFAGSDIVITAGGASVGEHDLVKPAFEALGGTVDFWRVALKPGKPFFFGTLPASNGSAQKKYLFGVPGNPVSAFVTTILLVLPAVRKLLGAAHCEGFTHPGQLAEELNNPDGRRHFIRVCCDPQGAVRSSGPQGSHLLNSLAAANGLVDVPPRTRWPAGTVVQVLRWSA